MMPANNIRDGVETGKRLRQQPWSHPAVLFVIREWRSTALVGVGFDDLVSKGRLA